MNRKPINSSALQSVAYDAYHQVLELEFRRNGGVWQYFSIPPSVYDRFRNAKSLGRFFVKKIKGKFTEKRVDQD